MRSEQCHRKRNKKKHKPTTHKTNNNDLSINKHEWEDIEFDRARARTRRGQ